MILLADRCVGTSAVIENGQSLIGGMDILVCRNYFGSQISSFEMATPAPPGMDPHESFPGVFIRAPAILHAGPQVQVLGRVSATPCRSAAVVLMELEKKMAAGENVIQMGVVDALDRQPGHTLSYIDIEKKGDVEQNGYIQLPGAAHGTNARQVICAARKDHTLITAFHPELTHDYRWHEYFYRMVKESCTK
jgi:5'-phosphate synthase pdxT subunit